MENTDYDELFDGVDPGDPEEISEKEQLLDVDGGADWPFLHEVLNHLSESINNLKDLGDTGPFHEFAVMQEPGKTLLLECVKCGYIVHVPPSGGYSVSVTGCSSI